MTKFITLLDPQARGLSGSQMSIGQQALLARELFPQLVSRSNLRYWNPGQDFATNAHRFLLGLAPAFALPDLHLADIINEFLDKNLAWRNRIDVCDIEDAETSEELIRYFPDQTLRISGWHMRPILGVWFDGQYIQTLVGFKAVSYLLGELGIPLRVDELIQRMRPPDRKWFLGETSTIELRPPEAS